MQIHAGRYKGRRIKTVKNAPYRPTTSIVRKSLFDILKNISGKTLLDLFAGSGIIGFEALSRGAKTITFVDSSLRVNSLLKMNSIFFKEEEIIFIKNDVFKFLKNCDSYDFIFADPPYKFDNFNELIEQAISHLNDNGVFVLESSVQEYSISPYRGTFDPIHRGHIDIAERASKLFDQIIFSVAVNSEKNPLFSAEERIELILESTKHISNVKAYSTDGLIADFAREHNAVALIRGLRHVSDFEFEFQMATMNNHLNNNVSTLLMVTSEHYIHLNSTVVKDVAKLKGDISKYVTPNVMDRLLEKFSSS